MSNEPKYPEHVKLGAVKNESQIIGEFLEALPQMGLTLVDAEGDGFGRLLGTRRSIQDILAQHFGIDLKEIEREKQHMLDAIREKNRINDAMERDQ